ncbi:MAG: RelA/SpoT domain-containing protein [Pseudanabaenales cyanobacterium]|nr:RelA/SpoT domain-containing protein [Pseudanabaenales cyanobacterium]
MTWTELAYTKKAVRRAGDYLCRESSQSDPAKFSESFDILSNWRGSHAYPMKSMLGYFRKKAFEVDKRSVIVQRLKRAPSILAKLRREGGMKLDRMEDIAGCRIVVADQAKVYLVRDKIVNGRTRNILRRERNYIQHPKDSGYRGLHLVYRYNGQKTTYSKHYVELQIRSKIQHSWATAVEVVGTFTGQALKASQGTDDWLNFFRLASIAFEELEERKISDQDYEQNRVALIQAVKDLGVLPRLKAFAVSTELLEERTENKSDYFLLKLDVKASNIQVRKFPVSELQSATELYSDLEKQFENDSDKDVVLVSASSVNGLKKAYPNYFADTSDFAKYLKQVGIK